MWLYFTWNAVTHTSTLEHLLVENFQEIMFWWPGNIGTHLSLCQWIKYFPWVWWCAARDDLGKGFSCCFFLLVPESFVSQELSVWIAFLVLDTEYASFHSAKMCLFLLSLWSCRISAVFSSLGILFAEALLKKKKKIYNSGKKLLSFSVNISVCVCKICHVFIITSMFFGKVESS